MRSDQDIARDVTGELCWRPNLRGADIAVSVDGGVVRLTGSVESYAQRIEAEEVTEQVHGVRNVSSGLVVRLPRWAMRSDSEIAHWAEIALQWNVEVPYTRIVVRVDRGDVMLEGEVEWQYQREAVEQTLRHLTGIRGIVNRLAVRQRTASLADVPEDIRRSLRRSTGIDPDRITIESLDGRVILRGVVPSCTARREVERAAWAAPGVTRVEDELAVAT